MWKSLLKLSATLVLSVSYMANAGVVVESTRYLYKEGAREISAQYENKDDTPYLMKSWIEPQEGSSNSYFMVTPPLFRLEAKQRNTVRIFPNAYISNAPKDRDSLYFFNIMSIPPSNDSAEGDNTLQLAVRHRMRLIYRPKAIQGINIDDEVKNLEWKKNDRTITLKNPTPFFIYFKSVQINSKEFMNDIPHIGPYSTQDYKLPFSVSGTQVQWRIATEHGGMGSINTSSIR